MVKIIENKLNPGTKINLHMYSEINELLSKCDNDNITMKLDILNAGYDIPEPGIYGWFGSNGMDEETPVSKKNELLNFECIVDKSLITDELKDLLKQLYIRPAAYDKRRIELYNISNHYVLKIIEGYSITRKTKLYDDFHVFCDKHNLPFPNNIYDHEIRICHNDYFYLSERYFSKEKPEDSPDILRVEEDGERLQEATNNIKVIFKTTVEDIPRNREVIIKIFDLLSK